MTLYARASPKMAGVRRAARLDRVGYLEEVGHLGEGMVAVALRPWVVDGVRV